MSNGTPLTWARRRATTLALAMPLLVAACASAPPDPDELPASLAPLAGEVRAGSADAMERIGEAYQAGDGVRRDMPQALRWFLAAARAGSATAQDSVGMFYAGGLGGVEESCEQAITWFARAAESGNVESKNNMAWMLATCPDARHRDGQRALRLATEVLQALGPASSYLGTLAAAHAELGDFEQAVSLQERSLARMQTERSSATLVQEAQVRLAAYRAGRPWRGAAFDDPELYRAQR